MNFYAEKILPRLVDWVCSSKEISRARIPFLKPLKGQGLEIGFGSGTNLPFFPDTVEKLYALDPAHLGRKLSEDRLKEISFEVEFVDYDSSGKIPISSESLDFVVSTFTLCTIRDEDLKTVFAEVRRLLKKKGKFYFLEHGRSPESNVAFWQDKLTPLQKKIGGGCHLNRKIDELVQVGGFQLEEVKNFYLKGPKIGTYVYEGRATLKVEKFITLADKETN